LSCKILLVREAVKPPQTDQKYVAAVLDLGNIRRAIGTIDC